MISSLENGLELKANKIDLFNAMKIIDSAFKSISNQTIENCFRKAKFVFKGITTEVELSEDNDFDFWQHLKQMTNIDFNTFGEYVAIDENESIEFENELSEAQIAELIQTEKLENPIELSDEEGLPRGWSILNILYTKYEIIN